LLALDRQDVRHRFLPWFSLLGIPSSGVSAVVSVTEVFSNPRQLFLGYNVYGEVPRRVYAKVRITEFRNHRGEAELNLGVVMRDLARGPVRKAQRKRMLFPNTNYFGLSHHGIASGLDLAKSLAGRLGIAVVDIAPSHYHVYHLNRTLGGRLDPTHPDYHRQRMLLRHIESELDRHHIGLKDQRATPAFLRDRAWYVAERAITDPVTGQPGLAWPKPRQIVTVQERVDDSSTRSLP
jgi:hypothetical protein